jgi:hypothetical protein
MLLAGGDTILAGTANGTYAVRVTQSDHAFGTYFSTRQISKG